jgi:hypothetical protein
MSAMRWVLPTVAGLSFSGCGMYVPAMQEFYEKSENTPDEKTFENAIINNIKCEVHKGVQRALDDFDDIKHPNPKIQWLRGWGVTVSLKITADEKSGFNPGVSLNKIYQNGVTPFPVNGNVTTAQSFNLGLGVNRRGVPTPIGALSY